MKTHKYRDPIQKNTYRQGIYRLLVLVPHREVRLAVQKWCAELFNSGLSGAWSFPPVVPLALLSRPVPASELKQCAALLSAHNTSNQSKIKSSAPGYSAFPPEDSENEISGKMSVFGLALELSIPGSLSSLIENKAAHWFSPPVLGAALVLKNADSEKNEITEKICRIQPPQLLFRAAALAHMSYKPLSVYSVHAGSIYSYQWKIGPLYWLPRQRV